MWEILWAIGVILALVLAPRLLGDAIAYIVYFIRQLICLLFDSVRSALTRPHRQHEQIDGQTRTLTGTRSSRVASHRASRPALPYECKPYLLTLAERHFLDALREVVRDDIHICPQVAFGAVLKVTAAGWDYFRYWNKVKAKRIDFLLCDRRTLTPLVAVELDDSSHDLPKRSERDDFVDRACDSAGLAILRFRVRNHYDLHELRRAIYSAIDETRIAYDVPRTVGSE